MKTTWFILAAALLAAVSVRGAVAISGRPVPEMANFDTRMKNYMESNSITAGVLGIMYQGRTVYLRGFGELNPGTNLPENALFRVASLSKSITAAAVRIMATDGTFGASGLDRKAFNLQANGGLLSATPWPSLTDTGLANVTIRHLVEQTSGFGDPDCVFRDGSRQVSTDLGVGGPPTRMHRIRWMLGKAQRQYTPGTFNYSNFNYMVLGEIVDRFGGGYINFIRSRVLTPDTWIPASDVHHGATLLGGRLSREARYGNTALGPSVFDYSDPIENLSLPYGGYFDMDGLLGAGSIVASAQAMLQFASRFRLWYPNAGLPYTGSGDGAIHDGGLSGTSTRFTSRGDGVVLYMAVNKDGAVGGAYDQIAPLLDAGPGPATFTWPATTSDGHWITLPENNPAAGYGGYNAPWQGFGSSLPKADSGSRLRLKAGTSNWTGRITKRMKLDAPLGTARLGVQ